MARRKKPDYESKTIMDIEEEAKRAYREEQDRQYRAICGGVRLDDVLKDAGEDRE